MYKLMKPNAMVVTDKELVEKVQEILHVSDLKKTTNNIVIKKLEADFGVDLCDKKVFIRHQVDKFLQEQYHLSEEFVLEEGPCKLATADYNGLNACVMSSSSDDDDDDYGGGNGGGGGGGRNGGGGGSNGGGGGGVSLGHGNGTSNKLQGSLKQNKVKNKKVCEPGKICILSPYLQKLLGVPQLARTEVVKRFWSYVRDKNLQNPQDGKTINCDESLRTLLGVDSINILQIEKALKRHMRPLDPTRNPAADFYGAIPHVLSSDEDHVNEDDEGGGRGPGGAGISLARGNESSDKLQRSPKQNKVKNKRVCESGKICTLSPQLQKFLGVPQLSQKEVVKRFWSYVKGKNLQNPQDRKTINCDEALRALLGVESINIVQIKKTLTKHMLPSVKLTREKPRKQDREDPYEAELDAKRPRKVYSGFLAPLPLSGALIKFLDTGETALTRAAVIKRLWGYIKDKNLQDPSDKKTVICDERLKELFNVDSFHGFLVSKLLSPHFVKM